jgi:hypothetical protein
MIDVRPDVTALRQFLLAGRNADGGWGYYPGKASRLEPTSWSLLALADGDPSVLTAWPAEGGLLRERRDGDVNFAFHALALITLIARRVEHAAGNQTLLSRLQQARGIALSPAEHNRQNNSLQGWSWIDGTFSWVEPTSWVLLALRRSAQAGLNVDASRVNDGEMELVERCCETGGWNYGNSNRMGKELRPYVPTTAVALLALRRSTSPATASVVDKSVQYLERAAGSEPSALALSLASMALDAYGRPSTAPKAALAGVTDRTMALGSHLGGAMSFCALNSSHADAAFSS